jgi:hypothetical protein
METILEIWQRKQRGFRDLYGQAAEEDGWAPVVANFRFATIHPESIGIRDMGVIRPTGVRVQMSALVALQLLFLLISPSRRSGNTALWFWSEGRYNC